MHPFFLFLPCPPHPSPGQFSSPKYSLSGTSDLLFLVEKRQPARAGLGDGSGRGRPTGKKGKSFFSGARKKGEKTLVFACGLCLRSKTSLGRQKVGFVKGWLWRTYPRSGFSFRGNMQTYPRSGFWFRVNMQMYPGSGFRSGGTSAKASFGKTTLLSTPELCVLREGDPKSGRDFGLCVVKR